MADTWTAISGYTPQDYTDTAVFEVDSDTKKIALITGQPLVAGEENAQYMRFSLDRYWDGIDIKDKAFYVEFALAGTYYGKTAAVNAEYNTERIRFGWVVPKEACCISGTLLFVLRIESTDYVLKTQIAEHPVYKSVNGGDVVPEPTKEAWYRDFAARVEVAIDEAGAALAQAQQAVTSAETAAQNAQTSEENAEMAAAMAQTRYGSPLTAAEADKMIDQNRVYVYIGSEAGYTYGHWYYYNGAAWTDGGVYNGSAVNTDTTLTQSGMAADAKATGDEISELKSGFNELDYQINGAQSGESVDIAQSTTWTDGYTIQWNTGGRITLSSGCFATIPVSNVSHISGYTRGGLEETRGIAFCKADGTWISGDYNAGGSSYDWNYSLDVPSDAEIVKISCTTSNKDRFTCVGTLRGSGGLVDGLNIVNNKIGNIESLDTKNKSNLVGAINEAYSKASEEKVPDGYDSLRLDVSGIENAIGYKYDEQFFTFSEKTDGYYWIKSGNEVIKFAVSGMTAYAKVFVPAGTYFCARISGANTFIQNANDPTDIKARNSLVANADGSYTIDYDFYLYASHTISDGAEGYWATTTLTGVPVEGRYNVSDDVSAIENGNTVSYTGSWNQTRLGDFKQGTYWKIKLVSYGQTSAIEFKGLPDATDTSTNDTLFTLKAGQEILWSPLKNYEAIRYGANGSCTVEINDCTSIYDKLERNVFYCGANREYTKLIDAISAAEMYMGAILYVDAGTYDLVQEFGDDYFAGITTEAMPGIVLKNRIHIVFSPNSRVVCHYEGNNDKVLTNFSPFNCGQFGFTLENLNLDSSRTRYAIHDERNGGIEQCLSRYINCNIKQDNSQNATWGSYCCIGGGLGANHEVVIENCTFESVARDETEVHGTVSYHPSNKTSTDFACELVVKDNYFVTGTLEISGSRTDAVNDTTVIVTNNSFEHHNANAESGIYYSGYPTYQGSHYNIRSWNNEIRHAS